MRLAAITIDVDRDVNMPLPGRREAGSAPRDGNDTPRFASSTQGLSLIVELLNDMSIRGTFFLEADTARHIASEVNIRNMLRGHEIASHGHSHEDLTGKKTGVFIDIAEKANIIDKASQIIQELTGQFPKGFRAPYQNIDNTVLELLAERGYLYDSSITNSITNGRINPHALSSGLIEIPLAKGVDANGKSIHSYLWPMHEGKRQPGDYLDLLDQYDDGLLVLATHSWHIVETFTGPLSRSLIDSNLDNVRMILDEALEKGIEFITLDKYVEKFYY
ncbi:MAG: polysaccharide deacetylase family protein [Euryarchaeota archaeon]|nr:polysaccharide deacetylase family protein [Euryarchaeota archaeon]